MSNIKDCYGVLALGLLFTLVLILVDRAITRVRLPDGTPWPRREKMILGIGVWTWFYIIASYCLLYFVVYKSCLLAHAASEAQQAVGVVAHR